MINKKNLLGHTPDTLGDKDAIHVAIVAVRANKPIIPGQRCGMTKDREAVPDDKGVGVADPFRKGVITPGQTFWLLLDSKEVPNVQHVWESETDFSAPTVKVQLCPTLIDYAVQLGVTYDQLMTAVSYVVENEKPAPYPGTLSNDQLIAAQEDLYDLWSYWGEETLHKFPKHGTNCCPEYQYPDCDLFVTE